MRLSRSSSRTVRGRYPDSTSSPSVVGLSSIRVLPCGGADASRERGQPLPCGFTCGSPDPFPPRRRSPIPAPSPPPEGGPGVVRRHDRRRRKAGAAGEVLAEVDQLGPAPPRERARDRAVRLDEDEVRNRLDPERVGRWEPRLGVEQQLEIRAAELAVEGARALELVLGDAHDPRRGRVRRVQLLEVRPRQLAGGARLLEEREEERTAPP